MFLLVHSAFIGFVKGGIPLGVTFSFLITSPLVNEVAVAMFLGLFGLKATLIYAVSGILLGVVGGYVLGKMKLEQLSHRLGETNTGTIRAGK